MRLNLKLTGNISPVSFDHLHLLTSRIHNWIGDNDLHDAISLYSFGWLRGGRSENGHLTFPRGASWRLSFYDADVAKRLINGIMKDPEVMAGMRVFEAKEQEVPSFSGCYRFKVDGPVVARRNRDDGSREYLLYDDEAADAALTRTLRSKMMEVGLKGDLLDTEVQFDRTYQHAHTKLAEVKGTRHKGSVCPVVVTGPPAAVQFAWKVGVGELTGSGFGALQ